MRRQAIRYRPIPSRDLPRLVIGEQEPLPVGALVAIAVGFFLLAVAVVWGVLGRVVGQ